MAMIGKPRCAMRASGAGSLDHASTVKTMTLFAKEVYPQIRELPRTKPLSTQEVAE